MSAEVINQAALSVRPSRENFPNLMHRAIYTGRVLVDAFRSNRMAHRQTEVIEAVMTMPQMCVSSEVFSPDPDQVRSTLASREQEARERLFTDGTHERAQFILDHNLGTPALQESILTALDD